MSPATTAAWNVARRGILVIFIFLFKFCQVLSSSVTACQGIRGGP